MHKTVPLECTTAMAWAGFDAFIKVLKAIEGGDITMVGNREKHITAIRHAYKAMVEAA